MSRRTTPKYGPSSSASPIPLNATQNIWAKVQHQRRTAVVDVDVIGLQTLSALVNLGNGIFFFQSDDLGKSIRLIRHLQMQEFLLPARRGRLPKIKGAFGFFNASVVSCLCLLQGGFIFLTDPIEVLLNRLHDRVDLLRVVVRHSELHAFKITHQILIHDFRIRYLRRKCLCAAS